MFVAVYKVREGANERIYVRKIKLNNSVIAKIRKSRVNEIGANVYEYYRRAKKRKKLHGEKNRRNEKKWERERDRGGGENKMHNLKYIINWEELKLLYRN